MIAKLFKEQRPLMVAGLLFMVGGIVLLGLSVVDDVQILGISRWIKPMKFYFSVGIFLWTIAIYLRYLPDHERFSRILSWSFIVIFLGELIAVTGQAIRGTTSHFNIATPLDGFIFGAMGLLIAISTLLTAVILVAYFRYKVDLPPTLLWGMRLGLLIFLAGSIQGGYMSAHLSHTVGAADGGPGLPLVNWSTVAGDLRVAHFLGLHAIQIMPVVGIVVDRTRLPLGSLYGVAVLYVVIFIAVLAQALLGRPLVAI